MTLVRCSSCDGRGPEKLAQVTWAWYRADQERTAYRQRLCMTCFCTNVLPLDKPLDFVGGLTCPACGIDTEHDMDACYVTAFLPGQGKVSYELPTCASCAVDIRARAQIGAQRLENREIGSRGQDLGPSTPVTRSPWAALGLTDAED